MILELLGVFHSMVDLIINYYDPISVVLAVFIENWFVLLSKVIYDGKS